jgi:hypothetical protein
MMDKIVLRIRGIMDGVKEANIQDKTVHKWPIEALWFCIRDIF